MLELLLLASVAGYTSYRVDLCSVQCTHTLQSQGPYVLTSAIPGTAVYV
jgi:hypothetical protein